MIVERVIHAGDTPLACTIRVEQTGPMEITVRAGVFTTTGQSRVVPAPFAADLEEMDRHQQVLDATVRALGRKLARPDTDKAAVIDELQRTAISMERLAEARAACAARKVDLDAVVASGRVEMLPDGRRARLWVRGADGEPVERSTTYALAADQVIELAVDPEWARWYTVDLVVSDGGAVDVLARSRLDEQPSVPAGWRLIHPLVFPFAVPAGCLDLAEVPVLVLAVRPGFPPGTGPEDWRVQSGGA